MTWIPTLILFFRYVKITVYSVLSQQLNRSLIDTLPPDNPSGLSKTALRTIDDIIRGFETTKEDLLNRFSSETNHSDYSLTAASSRDVSSSPSRESSTAKRTTSESRRQEKRLHKHISFLLRVEDIHTNERNQDDGFTTPPKAFASSSQPDDKAFRKTQRLVRRKERAKRREWRNWKRCTRSHGSSSTCILNNQPPQGAERSTNVRYSPKRGRQSPLPNSGIHLYSSYRHHGLTA